MNLMGTSKHPRNHKNTQIRHLKLKCVACRKTKLFFFCRSTRSINKLKNQIIIMKSLLMICHHTNIRSAMRDKSEREWKQPDAVQETHLVVVMDVNRVPVPIAHTTEHEGAHLSGRLTCKQTNKAWVKTWTIFTFFFQTFTLNKKKKEETGLHYSSLKKWYIISTHSCTKIKQTPWTSFILIIMFGMTAGIPSLRGASRWITRYYRPWREICFHNLHMFTAHKKNIQLYESSTVDIWAMIIFPKGISLREYE